MSWKLFKSLCMLSLDVSNDVQCQTSLFVKAHVGLTTHFSAICGLVVPKGCLKFAVKPAWICHETVQMASFFPATRLLRAQPATIQIMYQKQERNNNKLITSFSTFKKKKVAAATRRKKQRRYFEVYRLSYQQTTLQPKQTP